VWVFAWMACSPAGAPPSVDFTTDPGLVAQCVGDGLADSRADGTIDQRLTHSIGEGWSTLEELSLDGGSYVVTHETTDAQGEILSRDIEATIEGVEYLASERWTRDLDGRPLTRERVEGELYLFEIYIYAEDLLARIEHYSGDDPEPSGETHFAYDPDGRKIEERTDWDVRRWVYAAPAPALDAQLEQDISDDGIVDVASDLSFDGYGRLVGVAGENIWATTFTSEWVYEEAGHLVRYHNLTVSEEEGSVEQEWTHRYDAAGRVLESEWWLAVGDEALTLFHRTTWSWSCAGGD
jgi:YD repeat-containing protein